MEIFVNTKLTPNFHGACITVIQTAGENQPFKNFHTKKYTFSSTTNFQLSARNVIKVRLLYTIGPHTYG